MNRAWNVLHAASDPHGIADLIECQIAFGMRPFLLTERGDGAAALWARPEADRRVDPKSLMNAWTEVRQWRKSFDDAGSGYDVAHVHCFPAGMTCARSGEVFVYDVQVFVEQLATASDLSYEHSWMGRSFRVAEHFVLTRAAAVIAHTPAMKQAIEQRGAKPDRVHVIPDPIEVNEQPLLEVGQMMVHAPDAGVVSANIDAISEVVAVLAAFKRALEARPQLRLCLVPDESLMELARNCATSLGVVESVVWGPQQPRAGDVVIAGAVGRKHRLLTYAGWCANHTCVSAMRQGCTLLAADSDCNRAVSSGGEGLLWFAADQPSEMSAKLCRLVEDREFSRALAAAGRAHVVATRSYFAVGKQYDEVYRLASRRDTDVSMRMSLPLTATPKFEAV